MTTREKLLEKYYDPAFLPALIAYTKIYRIKKLDRKELFIDLENVFLFNVDREDKPAIRKIRVALIYKNHSIKKENYNIVYG